MIRHAVRGDASIWFAAALFAAAATYAFVFGLRSLEPWPAPLRLTWWMLAPVCLLAEYLVIKVRVRQDAYSLSLSEIPLVLGLFFAAPADLFLAHLVGATAALLIRRQRPARLAFNVSHFLVETSLAIVIFRAVGTPADPMEPGTWMAAILAVFAADAVGGVAMHAAAGLAEDRRPRIPHSFGLGAVAAVGNASLSLLLCAALWFRPSLAALLVVPAAMVVLGYRGYHAQTRQHEYQARHDTLTALWNRQAFIDAVDGHGAPDDARGTVFLIDLDRFREINDALGQDVGDRILVEVAERLRVAAGEDAAAARLGGDEFAIFVPGAEGILAAERRARLILERIREPIDIEGLALEIGASVGVSMSPADGRTGRLLLQRADVALYVAKRRGESYSVYSADDDHHTSARLGLVADLRRAIETRCLEVQFQPKVDLETRRVLGAEALVRWQHPEHGPLQPDEFIGLAEQTGLIVPLTSFVLDRALDEARRQIGAGYRAFHVSVNVSARSLFDASLVDEVAKALRRRRVPASALRIEITESQMMSDPARAQRVLTRLSDMGVQLSIDDFGTGYSSLAYIKRLPVREIKIDKSFVLGMREDRNDELIVRSVIDLGRNLGLNVVAEGIESEGLYARLVQMGCHIGQGFHIGRPLPPAVFREWMSEHAAGAAEQDARLSLVPRRSTR